MSTQRARSRSWLASKTVRRLAADPLVLLSLGLVVGALLVGAVDDKRDDTRLVAISILFLAAQAIAALSAPYLHPSSAQRTMITTGRFGLAILYVTVATGLIGDASFRPTAALYIPIVALAAALGTRQAVIVGVSAITIYLLPIVYATPEHLVTNTQRAIALGATTILLSIGTRRTVSALTVTVRRLGTALAHDRRRSRQLAAVESVGRLLAATGPSSETLDRIVTLLRGDLGYDFVSVYLGSTTKMRLAAQGGYDTWIEEFDNSTGVIGRVMRTKAVAWVPDVSEDPDYLSASGNVQAEISAPLLVEGELIGIVNVEARATADLDRSDVNTMTLVADRLASALALAGERERLADRAELFRRLTAFAVAINGTLDPDRLNQSIVDEVRSVVAADSVVLTVLDRATSQYLIRALVPADPTYLGMRIEHGEGLAGRAIRDRALVVDDQFDPSTSSVVRAGGGSLSPLAGAAAPLIRDDVVVGALTILRFDVERPFAPDELEAVPILAGLVALAVTNTFLHAEVTELSIRDSLTGLFNRRYLDATIARLESARQRRAPDDRGRAAVVIFDLDHFGAFNKQHGHQTGDQVLGAFADIIRKRFRGGDVVARYGGEEFLAVLDGATLDQAHSIAEEIRTSFALVHINGKDGGRLSATVSAGCAAMGADNDRFVDIIARADVGLVMAKRAGRNRVIVA
ncbi:MAG TPA: sensor domain-containing diguanylate cyclase [Verrucomicrobiae bacterium]|nr:sensor domain-containing diguanylate cyclase [Verrucomicrobiae bacterium]